VLSNCCGMDVNQLCTLRGLPLRESWTQLSDSPSLITDKYDLVANVTHEAVRVRDDSVEGEAEKKGVEVPSARQGRRRMV